MIGIGHLPEAYANFGLIGVMAIMFLQGLFFGYLDRRLNCNVNFVGHAIFLSIMIYFLNGIGSSTASLFVGSMLSFAPSVFMVYYLGLTRARREAPLTVRGVVPAARGGS